MLLRPASVSRESVRIGRKKKETAIPQKPTRTSIRPQLTIHDNSGLISSREGTGGHQQVLIAVDLYSPDSLKYQQIPRLIDSSGGSPR